MTRPQFSEFTLDSLSFFLNDVFLYSLLMTTSKSSPPSGQLYTPTGWILGY